MNTFKQFFKESQDIQIPLFDGSREIYYTSLSIKDYEMVKLVGINRMQEKHWDDPNKYAIGYIIGIYKNLDEALKTLAKIHPINYNSKNTQHHLQLNEAIWRGIPNLIGTWKIIDIIGGLHFGVDVDTASMRYGGLRDATQDTLTDDETSIIDW